MMPTADEVAVAIVTAARLLGADPIEAITGEPKTTYNRNRRLLATRARAYAARAIDKVFNGRHVYVARPAIARIVGVSPSSVNCYFPSMSALKKSWWVESIFVATVDALIAAHRPDEPRPVVAKPAAPKVAEQLRDAIVGDRRHEQLEKFSAGFGRPGAKHAGGDEQLIGRAQERSKLSSILAEAAANTAKLQEKIIDSDDGGDSGGTSLGRLDFPAATR